MKSLFSPIILGMVFSMFLVLTACQTRPYQPYARDVKRRPGKGGIVALNQTHRPEDRALADQMMGSNCNGKKVNVLEEGEVVTGEKTRSSASQTSDQGHKSKQVGTLFGLPITSSSQSPSTETSTESEKIQTKEWQIGYECDPKS
jgi:hypothetical protein